MDDLAWIHDCLLLRVVYESTTEEETQVLLHLRCPKDLGVAAWNGKDIVLQQMTVDVIEVV